MSAYDVLGISKNATVAEAKTAWRRLVSKHHPDHGGSEEKFKQVQDAWELIQSGKADVGPPPPPAAAPAQPAKSSFTQGFAQKQPAYSKPTRIKMPETVRVSGKHATYSLDITVTWEQAGRGVVVPFLHAGEVHDYMVKPGSQPRTHAAKMTLDNMIGKFPPNTVDLIVNLFVNG